MSLEKLPISLVVITLNESENIERCINSASFCRDVVVVDSHSTDDTVKRAQNLGARTFVRDFKGYRDQKQGAMEQAEFDWVLSLDADEELSPGLQEEIISIFKDTTSDDGFQIPRLSFHLGRWIKHGGWYPDYQLRFFRKSKARWIGGDVHEHVAINGKVGRLKANILHYVFKNLEDQIDTNNEYSSKGTANLIKKGESFSLTKMIFKPFGKFLECYVWKRGFLDGAAGFIIALGAAQSLFLKYAKLWESTLSENNN